MPTHKEDFNTRNKDGENLSEKVAKEYFCSGKYKFKEKFYIIQTGTNAMNGDITGTKIPGKVWKKVPRIIRNYPDFLIVSDNNQYYIECKGCKNAEVHFKILDLESYGYWNSKHIKVIMFVYDTTTNHFFMISYACLNKMIQEGNYKKDIYQDSKEEYYKVPVKDITLAKTGKSIERKK